MQRTLNLSSRRKLQPRDAARFAAMEPGLFRELAAVVCGTGILPQKELHECWQMAVAVHRAFPEHERIADIAAGHGLLAWILVLLAHRDAQPIARTAVAIDITRPPSAAVLAAAISRQWPELLERVHYVEGSVAAVTAAMGTDILFVAAHACGSLSDELLITAMNSRHSWAIMPCCHSFRTQALSLSHLALLSGIPAPEPTGEPVAVIDEFRKSALKACDYAIIEDNIQAEITPFHRIIMGRPLPGRAVTAPDASTMPKSAKQLGEIQAFEKIHSLPVNDREAMQALAQRPSREWVRAFDLSYWVDGAERGWELAEILNDLMSGTDDFEILKTLLIRDVYTDRQSLRIAYTYHIELKSIVVPITRDDAKRLRQHLIQSVQSLNLPVTARVND